MNCVLRVSRIWMEPQTQWAFSVLATAAHPRGASDASRQCPCGLTTCPQMPSNCHWWFGGTRMENRANSGRRHRKAPAAWHISARCAVKEPVGPFKRLGTTDYLESTITRPRHRRQSPGREATSKCGGCPRRGRDQRAPKVSASGLTRGDIEHPQFTDKSEERRRPRCSMTETTSVSAN